MSDGQSELNFQQWTVSHYRIFFFLIIELKILILYLVFILLFECHVKTISKENYLPPIAISMKWQLDFCFMKNFIHHNKTVYENQH